MKTTNLSYGIHRLEVISAELDDKKIREYVDLAVTYLKDAKQRGLKYPFTNICNEFEIHLPNTSSEWLEIYLTKRPYTTPTSRKVCKWFLLELYAMDLGLLPGGTSFYEPLIQILEMGGDFYEHHGDLCIENSGSISLGKFCNYS